MLVALLIGYLLGSIPFGLLVTRIAGKGDVRKFGSGNIGATNVLRTGGKALAALTLVLDVLKGAASVWVAQALMAESPVVGQAAAAGALIGHLYPVWLKFQGGKGVATLFGALIALWPAAALVYAIVWLAVLLVVRVSSVAGIAAVISAPIAAVAMGVDRLFPLLLGFALLIVWKHRSNIARLRSGAEPRIKPE